MDGAESKPPADLTLEIASFIVNANPGDVPETVLARALAGAVDGTAVLLAGRSEEATRIVHAYVEDLAAPGTATVAGSTLTTHPTAAALVNGTSAHAHDFDDTQISAHPDHLYGLLTHPTSSVWAATLAAAEAAEASGEETLMAYLVGIEVACRLCDATAAFHYIRGFHTTQTIAVFGTTAAASRLLGLSVDQTVHALGLATSMAAGLRVNFGSMTKPFHAGRAAESGLLAAQLARRGMTANRNALAAPGGFFKTFASDLQPGDPVLAANPLWGYQDTGSPGFAADRIQGKLGKPWYFETPGLSIKPFPSVVLSHPSMLALLQLLKTHDVAPADIAKIRVHAGATVLHIMYRIPETGTQGKFSLVFCMALIALRRGARLADFNDAFVKSEEALRMMEKVELLEDNESASRLDTIASRVELLLADGRRFEQAAGAYKGGPDNPLTDAELDEKFLQCAAEVFPEARAREALQAVRDLRRHASVRALTQALRADPAQSRDERPQESR